MLYLFFIHKIKNIYIFRFNQFIMPEKVSGNNFSDKSDLTSLNSNHTSIEPKSAVQLNSTEQKLDTLQKMADDSPYSQRSAHLTSMANNSIQKQPCQSALKRLS
jgi:hypothetical protein